MNPKNPDGKEPYTLEWLELIGFKNDDQCTAGVSYHWINAGRKSIFDLQYHHLDEDGELPENGEGCKATKAEAPNAALFRDLVVRWHSLTANQLNAIRNILTNSDNLLG